MKTITQIKSLFVNNTNQVEVVYDYTDVDEEGFKVKGTEGRVWSPTDDMASDTLSGVHPDVVKLATTYWSPEVVTAFSANLIALQTAERDKQQAAIDTAAAKKLEAEAAAAKEIEDAKVRETAANEAKEAAEAAEAASKAAADAAQAEADRLTAALAAQVAAEKALADKQAFDKAVADAVAAQTKFVAEVGPIPTVEAVA